MFAEGLVREKGRQQGRHIGTNCCAVQRLRPLGGVNHKVIEKRSVHVTTVYSVHSPFICRFS